MEQATQSPDNHNHISPTCLEYLPTADGTLLILHIIPTKKKTTNQANHPVFALCTHPGRTLIRKGALQVSVVNGDGAGVTHTWVALHGALLCPRHIRTGAYQ